MKKSTLAKSTIITSFIIIIIGTVFFINKNSTLVPSKETPELYTITQDISFHQGSNELVAINRWWKSDTLIRVITQDHYLLTTKVIQRDTTCVYVDCSFDIKVIVDTLTVET